MKKVNPYAQDIALLLEKAREKQNRSIAVAKEKRHYAGVLVCRRKRMVWSEFNKEMQEFTTTYFISKIRFIPSNYYNSYELELTEDYTMAKRFAVANAVAWQHSLAFEVEVDLQEVPKDWIFDGR